jgi:lipoprotein NlpD
LDYRALASWNRVPHPYRIYPDQQLRLTPPPRTKPVVMTQKPAATASKPGPVALTQKPTAAPPKRESVAATQQPTAITSKPKPIVSESAREKSPPPQAVPKSVVKPTKTVNVQTSNGSLHWIWPTRGSVVQEFRKGDRTRQGIRIAGNVGQSVLAAESGRVVYTGSGLPGYGKLIIIKHNKNYLSAYGFNRKLLVKDGKTVNRGERVAEMGRSADGKALLHFEIRRRDTPLNPLKLLPR